MILADIRQVMCCLLQFSGKFENENLTATESFHFTLLCFYFLITSEKFQTSKFISRICRNISKLQQLKTAA